MNQQVLSFERKRVNEQALVDALCFVLRGSGWLSSRALQARLGLTDRGVRHIAKLAQGRVISGQKGYHATAEATCEEVMHFANWMRSQAREMELRAYQAEREMHRREPVSSC